MGKPTAFMELAREATHKRPVRTRVTDHAEITLPFPEATARAQASRCMDCGIPFCHEGCPLGNRIPEFNDFVYRGDWAAAEERLSATNNFPEFTGRLCPAPCESACVLAIQGAPVTIKQLEHEIADRITQRKLEPIRAVTDTGKRVAVVGSGPAGLAAAQELARRGHRVTVMERADKAGGLLRYGIPDFKMDKALVDRRIAQLEQEGVRFELGVEVGVTISAGELLANHNAICIAVGAEAPRDVPVPGRDLPGVHFAMEYLSQQNRVVRGDRVPEDERITAAGKRVVILGGGDTGADCLGTALRQNARSVLSLEIAERPPETRAPGNPWPLWPHVFRLSPADEEGGVRAFAVMTTRFEADHGRVARVVTVDAREEPRNGRMAFEPIPDSERTIDAELVLIAAGFTGPRAPHLLEGLGVALDNRGAAVTDAYGRTNVPRVYAAGDAHRGASLVVWAIAEGRRAAETIHDDLVGRVRLALAR